MAETIIEQVEPFGYYVLLSLLENEKNNDEWVCLKGVLVAKESSSFDHSYWARVVRVGSLCKEDLKAGDIVRLNKIFSKEEYRDLQGNRYFLTKEDNIIAKMLVE